MRQLAIFLDGLVFAESNRSKAFVVPAAPAFVRFGLRTPKKRPSANGATSLVFRVQTAGRLLS